jgi:glyceraldehyde 3-phosphate dehydrogenase
MMDLNLIVSKKTSKDELSAIFQQASEGELKNILFLDKEKMVSQDILGLSYSTIVANDLLQVIDGDMIKIMAWYDNEWGYSNRLIEMAQYILKQER